MHLHYCIYLHSTCISLHRCAACEQARQAGRLGAQSCQGERFSQAEGATMIPSWSCCSINSQFWSFTLEFIFQREPAGFSSSFPFESHWKGSLQSGLRLLHAQHPSWPRHSGFKSGHSTPPVLFSVRRLLGQFLVLIHLDLSAALIPVSHHILLATLSEMDISRKVLSWLNSYVNRHSGKNKLPPLTHSQQGCPKYQCWGPSGLCSTYLGSVIRSHGLSYHCYNTSPSHQITPIYLGVSLLVHLLS